MKGRTFMRFQKISNLAVLVLLPAAATGQEDFPLRFTILEAHHTQTPKCFMTIQDQDDMKYVVEEVTLFGCQTYTPGSTNIQGKRDKQWFDLVGTDKKGKAKVTRWEIEQEFK